MIFEVVMVGFVVGVLILSLVVLLEKWQESDERFKRLISDLKQDNRELENRIVEIYKQKSTLETQVKLLEVTITNNRMLLDEVCGSIKTQCEKLENNYA